MDLFDFFTSTVIPLRKSLEVNAISGGLPVVDSYRMTSTAEYTSDDTVDIIDVHFICVGVKKALAEPYKERFGKLIGNPPFQALIDKGATFIELGNILGSETAALYMMALGKHYGFCRVVLPSDLGLDGDEADIAASEGSVIMVKKETEAPKEEPDE